MEAFLDVLSWICIIAGGIFSLIGGVGMLRLPDFFTRLHAASLTDTLGAILMVAGLLLQAGSGISFIKLLLILAFLLFTSPVATHALAQAALHGGVRPKNVEDRTDGAGIPAPETGDGER